MPTDVGRALSIQQQYAIEVISLQSARMAAQMLRELEQAATEADVNRIMDNYEVMLLGAMAAAAATRVGYLQSFVVAEGMGRLPVPAQVLRPSAQDVMVGGRSPLPKPAGVGADIAPMEQVVLRPPSNQGPMWAALARLRADVERGRADALDVAVTRIENYTEAAVVATPDYVDRMVLWPNRNVVAMRRVAHPSACDRCQRVAGVLVFKTRPSLRHERCRCSFEPVLLSDPAYQARLRQYEANAGFIGGGRGGGPAYSRDRRTRGRRQLQAAQARVDDDATRRVWHDFLKDEQKRLAKLVTAVPSDQYRNWAVLTSTSMTKVGGDLLPVITRN